MSAADDLAALHHQVSLASSASDHDLAFHLQLSVAIHASLLLQQPSNAAAPAPPEEPSDASCALAVHAADLARRPGPGRRLRPRRRARRPLRARPRRHPGGPVGPRRRLLRAAPRRRGRALPRVVQGHGEQGGGGPAGEVVLRIHKPVLAQQGGFVGGRMTLEAMALVEALNAALGLGIRTLNVLTDNKPLHNHMIGLWRPRQKRLVDLINEAFSAKQKFEQCEILCVARTQVNYVTKLATDSLQTQIAKVAAVSAGKEKRENCNICLEDTDVSKIHAVEGCAHRFCFSCMKEHVKVKLLHGMLPACPQDGCSTKLTVEGSKMFLSPRLLAIMVQRIREAQIPPTHKIYCPYPKCSALMSMRELIHPMQASSSKYTVVDAATLRKCVKCSGSFCISCKVPWHDQMTCYDYKRRYPHARLEDAYLQNLAQQRLWCQCIRCKHMIELAEGCYHMTCVCGFEFCYTCGKEWKEKKATCSCPLRDERNIIRDDPQGNAAIHDDPEDEYDDYYDEDDNNYYVGEGLQYNVDYHRQYDGGDRHRGHFYQYNR